MVSADPLEFLELETDDFPGSREHAPVIKTGTHGLGSHQVDFCGTRWQGLDHNVRHRLPWKQLLRNVEHKNAPTAPTQPDQPGTFASRYSPCFHSFDHFIHLSHIGAGDDLVARNNKQLFSFIAHSLCAKHFRQISLNPCNNPLRYWLHNLWGP